ncbi:MAG: hypothetical protein Q4P15_01880 [Propionibacteriaceae bacterium]|nr:hypothetical protein [Propionibacteriaceae bacterium]
MSYWWKPGSGAHSTDSMEAAGLMPRFEGQEQAEEWLSLFFNDLQEHGVGDVSLFEEDRLVYGPMSLEG